MERTPKVVASPKFGVVAAYTGVVAVKKRVEEKIIRKIKTSNNAINFFLFKIFFIDPFLTEETLLQPDNLKGHKSYCNKKKGSNDSIEWR